MSGEISDDVDPEQRMTEQDEQLSESIDEAIDNERQAEFRGELTTEGLDLDDALSKLQEED